MVQVRDIESWKILKGVKCGDLGPKIGFNPKDNGWCSFDHVRIPRTHMMMGLCEVNRDGELSVKGDPRVLYSVMMGIRMLLVKGGGLVALLGVKIALRYCCVRRQFSTLNDTKDERKVLDYQTNSFAMAKLLSRSIVMAMAGEWVIGEH